MARKKKTRRRKPAFSILNAIEALAYSSLLTEGIAGTSLTGFLFGDSDLGMTTTSTGYDSWRGSQTLSTTITGADEISLGDLVTEPTMAINLMTKNFQITIII